MRKTIDIPEPYFTELKVMAARAGKPLKHYIQEILINLVDDLKTLPK